MSQSSKIYWTKSVWLDAIRAYDTEPIEGFCSYRPFQGIIICSVRSVLIFWRKIFASAGIRTQVT